MTLRFPCSIALTLCLLPGFAVSFAKERSAQNLRHAHAPSLCFIENKGQVTDQYFHQRKDIDFKLQGSSVSLFIGSAQLHYMWYSPFSAFQHESNPFPTLPQGGRANITTLPGKDRESGQGEALSYRMDVTLLGANPQAAIVTDGAGADFDNYYSPQYPGGITMHNYRKITYRNIYPNIDWEIEASSSPSRGGETAQGCKYNFIVHPGGDYRNIRIQYSGATALSLKEGALVAATPMGSITEQVPYTYDAVTKKEIKSGFELNGNILSYNISFSQGEGRDEAFIIDPTLSWGTYYGGAGGEAGGGTCTDTAGYVYFSGATNSVTNIATSGTHQAVLAGGTNAYVAKFDKNGIRQWGTYCGAGLENFNAVYADKYSNLYCAGQTQSTSGIVSSSSVYQPAYGGGVGDKFLVKFDAQTGLRTWATYYGGNGNEDGRVALNCDDSGYIYLGGMTGSTNNMASTGAYQTTPGIGFLAKFSPTGARLWGTYISGVVYGIDTRDTMIVICGETISATGIATAGAYQTALTGSAGGYIMKFGRSGSPVWGTYFCGTTNSTHCTDVAIDGNGDICAVGMTSGAGIATIGAHQTSYGGLADAFLVKMNGSGTARVWSTYYGGAQIETDYPSVSIGLRNMIYISGITESSSGIASPNAYRTTLVGSTNTFLAVFKTNGVRAWGSYYGGGGEVYRSQARYAKGVIFLRGNTTSQTNISTPLSHQPVIGSTLQQDAYLVAFLADTMVYIKQRFTDTVFCSGDSLHLKYDVINSFRTGNVFTAQLSNSAGSFASPVNIGTAVSGVAGTINCVLPVVPAGTGYRVRIIASLPADTSDDDGYNIRFFDPPAIPVATASSPCPGQTLALSATSGTTGVTWSWEGPNSFTASSQNTSVTNMQSNKEGDYIVTVNLNGCKRRDTVMALMAPYPAKPNAGSNSPVCSGQTLSLTANTTPPGVSWNWTGPSFTSSLQNPAVANIQPGGAGNYIVTATLGNCSSADTEMVVVIQGPAVNAYPSPNDTVCAGSSVTLVALPLGAGTGPSYQWYKGGVLVAGATAATYKTIPANGDVFYCMMTPGTGTSCGSASISSNQITITVLPVIVPGVSVSATPAGPVSPSDFIQYTSVAVNAGTNPKYQWLRNGQPVVGALSSTWSTQGYYIGPHDTICVIMTSSETCALPKSDTACTVVPVLTGVNDVNKNTSLSVYPNPNDGMFTFYADGITVQHATIEITDAVGQVVYMQNMIAAGGVIRQTMDINILASGIYILKLKTGDEVHQLKLIRR